MSIVKQNSKTALIFFCSNNPDGFTRKLCDKALESLNIVNTEYIEVYKTRVAPCNHCKVCEKEPICPYNGDDMGNILTKIDNHDIIIVATPIFYCSVPAPFKLIMDRTQQIFVRKQFLKLGESFLKKGILISTAGCNDSFGQQSLQRQIKLLFDTLSIDFTGHIALSNTDLNPEITLQKDVIEDINNKLNIEKIKRR